MTENQLEELFEKHSEDEYLEFERIQNPKHTRRDICAMLIIHEIQSRNESQRQDTMISWAGHEEIYLDVNVEEISEYITEEEIIDLIRCGVRLEESNFAMFI